ncbi:MAG: oxygenase MpaB family protein, partial [Actinomycetota bacterium]
PEWAQQVAIGNDVGLFGPDSAVWEVHGCIATLVGGIRALLMQAAHPAALTGVAEHSAYDTDPLGRLERTTRWLTITSFGSTEAIEIEARRVRQMHKRVQGIFEDKTGSHVSYSASDPRFLLWVHCAFTDSFLRAHEELGYPLPQGADRYVNEWAKSAQPLGLTDAPHSKQELQHVMATFAREEVTRIAMTPPIVGFILRPPFSRGGLFVYRILANAAISTIDEPFLSVLGLKKKSKNWLTVSRVILDFLSYMLGHESPSQKIARKRIQALQ